MPPICWLNLQLLLEVLFRRATGGGIRYLERSVTSRKADCVEYIKSSLLPVIST